MKLQKLSFYLSTFLISTQFYANDMVNLETIKVTTTSLGEEKNIEDVQASIEVIDKSFIENSNARSVPQLLNNALGVDVNDTGSTSSISIRGFSGAHTLILVDGLRRTGKYGNSDLTSVQLEDIERIEIVRGPMSALYGADGMAGVINVITNKNPKKDYLKLTLLGGVAQNGQRDTYITKLNGATIGKKYNSQLFCRTKRKR